MLKYSIICSSEHSSWAVVLSTHSDHHLAKPPQLILFPISLRLSVGHDVRGRDLSKHSLLHILLLLPAFTRLPLLPRYALLDLCTWECLRLSPGPRLSAISSAPGSLRQPQLL